MEMTEQLNLFDNETFGQVDLEDAALSYFPPDDDPAMASPPPTRALVESMQANGLWNPVRANRIEDGKLGIITGRRRVKAARLLGWETIPTSVWDIPAGSQYLIELTDHATRHDNAVADYQAILGLFHRGFDDKKIAAKTGMPLNVVRRRMKLGDLHATLKFLLVSGKLSLPLAEQVAKLDLDDQRDVIRRLEGGERLTLAKIGQYRKAQVSSVNLELELDFVPDPLQDDIETLKKALELASQSGGRQPPAWWIERAKQELGTGVK